MCPFCVWSHRTRPDMAAAPSNAEMPRLVLPDMFGHSRSFCGPFLVTVAFFQSAAHIFFFLQFSPHNYCPRPETLVTSSGNLRDSLRRLSVILTPMFSISQIYPFFFVSVGCPYIVIHDSAFYLLPENPTPIFYFPGCLPDVFRTISVLVI